MKKQIFKTVQDAVEWLNNQNYNYLTFDEEILSNYDLEVEGMNCIRYKSDDEEWWLAFFKIENGKVVDFENIEIGFHAILCDYEDIVYMLDEDFESIVEKFYSYLDGRPLKEGENILRVLENWINTKEYDDLEDFIRHYEYYVLIRTAGDIAEKYANKKVNAVVSVDELVK